MLGLRRAGRDGQNCARGYQPARTTGGLPIRCWRRSTRARRRFWRRTSAASRRWRTTRSNSQDICGPTSHPDLFHRRGRFARKSAHSWKTARSSGTLIVDNEVEIGTGVTYNIMGKIRGKSLGLSDSWSAGITICTSYGFQDDNCAVGARAGDGQGDEGFRLSA